jgi:hypothetical protein
MTRAGYWKKKPEASSHQPESSPKLPFFAFLGEEARDARDPSKVLPGGYRAPRGVIFTVHLPASVGGCGEK